MRVGFNCIVTLLELQGRRVEVVFPNETKEDLEADFIASITSHVCDCTGGAATSRGQIAFVSVSSRQRSMKNAYKSELDPNNKQSTAMRQHVGAARWAYNWGDAHNKAARAIPDKRPSVLVIEELNVKGMFKNCRLACALSDAAIGQFSLLSTALERGFGDQALFDGPGAERRENLCGGDRIDLSIDIV